MQASQRRIPRPVLRSVIALSLLCATLQYGSIPAHALGDNAGLAPAEGAAPVKRRKPIPSAALKDAKHRAAPQVPATAERDSTLQLRTEGEAQGRSDAPASAVASGGTAVVTTALQHAHSAKVSRCAPVIGQATRFTAAAPSATLSQWSTDKPDDHMFQALIGLGTNGAAAANAAVVLVASPEGRGCDATVVQVRPTAQSCAEIEGGLRKTGASLTNLSGMAVVQGAGTVREMLVPVPGAGCVIVGTGLALNK